MAIVVTVGSTRAPDLSDGREEMKTCAACVRRMQPSDLGLLPLNGYSVRFLAQELRI